MVVLSLDGLVKSLNKYLKENDITIIDKHCKGGDYEFLIKLINDIDHPKHYKIIIKEI